MTAKSNLNEFKKASQEKRPEEEGLSIEREASVIFRGRAMDSAAGTIAIKQEDGTTLHFRERDIVNLEENSKVFLVSVRFGAPALFKQTISFSVGDSDCECNEDHGADPVPFRFKLPYVVEGEDYGFPTISVDGSKLKNCMSIPVVKVRKVPVAAGSNGIAITRHVYTTNELICGAPWS